MRHDFADRAELQTYLQQEFPEAQGELSQIHGGRVVAKEKLAAYDARGYANTRNYLDGDVSQLSPYIRHGVLSLAEVRPGRPYKFVQELAWRDYWRRLYADLGEGVWQDLEEYKMVHSAGAYASVLPPAIPEASTGLACMDSFARALHETGYLHNHARMWMAAYVVHWRRVRWQAGARWFLQHLLDGDPASNNLSWQWVASTFSSKPYFFNRENLERYTKSQFCAVCPLATAGCPFDASYQELEQRLFRIA